MRMPLREMPQQRTPCSLWTSLVFLLGVLLLVVGPIHAAEVSWTGGGDGISFNDAANWTPQSVPGAADHAQIIQSGTYTVQMNRIITLDQLTLGGETGTQTLDLSGQSLTLVNDGGLQLAAPV
jgi:hypothetical protein